MKAARQSISLWTRIPNFYITFVSMLSKWGQWRADCGAKARVSVNLGHRGWPLLDTAGKAVIAAAANRLIGEVVQSRRRPLLGPSPG